LKALHPNNEFVSFLLLLPVDQFLQLLAAQTEQQQQGENNTQQEQEIATESSAS
jgi:hypothetical protein